MPALQPPRLEVVGDRHRVQPELLGAHGVGRELAGRELLRRRLVPDPQHRLAPHGDPSCPRRHTHGPAAPEPGVAWTQPTEPSVSAMATDLIDLTGHEQVAFCSDPDTGLRAIIALHDTALGPGPGRHPLPPVLLDGPGPRRRAAPVARHDEQERRRRARPRRRQGRHHRRPAPRQDPRAAARLRPVRRVPRRALRHGLRRRHLRRRHGRRRRVDPLGDGPLPRAGRRRRLLGAHGLRRLPGHARRRPARVGRADPRRAPGRRSPASARWGAGSPSTSSRTAPRWSSPTSTRMPCAALLRVHPPGARGRRRRRPGARAELDVFSPNALGGALDDETVDALRARVVCGGANNQLVSEGQGGTADRLRPAASPTPPTSSSTPAASSRSATSCTGSTWTGPASAPRRSSSTPSRCCATPMRRA